MRRNQNDVNSDEDHEDSDDESESDGESWMDVHAIDVNDLSAVDSFLTRNQNDVDSDEDDEDEDEDEDEDKDEDEDDSETDYVPSESDGAESDDSKGSDCQGSEGAMNSITNRSTEKFPEPAPPAFATPLKGPRKASSSSQIPLFVFITIAHLLHDLRIQTPHTAYIGGNLTSRAHQFDPKRRMPPSNVSRMTQNIVINARQDLAQTHRHYNCT